jgi:3-keto-disaccharide hydrolase
MNVIRCTRATLPALLCLSIAACGSSSSSSEDAGGAAATGGRATNTGAGGTATGNGGSAGLANSGSGGAGTASGGTVGAGSGGSLATGSGGSLVTGTGLTPGDAGSVDATGATGGAGGAIAGAPGPVAGTTSIFDGKTLIGWEQDTKTNLWSVVDGVIDGKGTTGGQLLMTQSDYGDFRIVVSSDLVAEGKTGHLGICFWGGRTPVGGYNGCKDIIPPGASSDPTVNTWDYGLKPKQAGLKGVTKLGTPKINSTWNTTEILCFLAKGFCRVAINGMAVLTYQEPNLQSIQRGPIGLQLHEGTNEEVQYKDVYVDPAPTVDQLLTVN